MPEIGCFCNPTTATSTAVICNDLLWSVIIKLLVDAKIKASNEGRKKGYSDGYEEGRYLASEDKEKACNATFEEGKKLGSKEGLEIKKDVKE
jgi:hypothetical protein